MSEDEFRAARAPRGKSSRHFLPMPARALAYALSCCLVLFVAYEKFQPGFKRSSSVISGAGASPRPEEQPTAPAPDDSIARASLRGTSPASMKTDAKAPGAPVGEKPPPLPPKTYTNEMLHQDLEAQKVRMGIVKILPKAPIETFNFSARAASLAGARPALLARGSGQPLAGALATGFVARSAEEQRRIWALRSLPTEGPKTDYSRKMLVVVFAAGSGTPVEIIGIRDLAHEIIVEFREVALPKAASPGKTSKPYQFRTIPISAKLVSFEKLP